MQIFLDTTQNPPIPMNKGLKHWSKVSCHFPSWNSKSLCIQVQPHVHTHSIVLSKQIYVANYDVL